MSTVSLVDRLRKDAEQMRATGLVRKGQNPLAEEAANRIAELEAALKPLVEMLELDFGDSDDDSESLDGRMMRATFGHLRTAARALGAAK